MQAGARFSRKSPKADVSYKTPAEGPVTLTHERTSLVQIHLQVAPGFQRQTDHRCPAGGGLLSRKDRSLLILAENTRPILAPLESGTSGYMTSSRFKF